jgi:hypothetical protein
MSLGLLEVVRRLGYHRATERTLPLHEKNRQMAIELALFYDETLPEGFEKDEAIKAVQLAGMWANASVATRLAPTETALPADMPPGHGEDLPPGAATG